MEQAGWEGKALTAQVWGHLGVSPGQSGAVTVKGNSEPLPIPSTGLTDFTRVLFSKCKQLSVFFLTENVSAMNFCLKSPTLKQNLILELHQYGACLIGMHNIFHRIIQ